MDYSIPNQILPKLCQLILFYFNRTWYNRRFVLAFVKGQVILSDNLLGVKAKNAVV